MQAASDFALVGGITFTALGIYLSVRQRRVHPLLLLCISAMSFSWIEAPYDWAMYAQFPPAIPRMPSWWPLNMTWGGLPLFVPVGYISYFVLPAVTGAALGRWVAAKFNWRKPQTLLVVGLIVGFCWALFFNGFLGAKLGVFYYGRVIPGLAIRERDHAPVPALRLAGDGHPDDAVHLPAGPHTQGRNVIEMWAQNRSKSRVTSSLLSVVAVIVIGNVLYGAVFAPHLATKLGGWVTTEPPAGELFPGVPNQPR
ncbi:hypothetical protein MTIM_12570 [Mycobacterium timonense]|uniref:DUF5135 domain-containing protein n=1 Tax=Mycobacterium timonense TaxID=701043 RepID=A0A7I9Z3B9_9MYCO|nr:hypothetical protein MTIM_12570 [Mycobacterium timonense]